MQISPLLKEISVCCKVILRYKFVNFMSKTERRFCKMAKKKDCQYLKFNDVVLQNPIQVIEQVVSTQEV